MGNKTIIVRVVSEVFLTRSRQFAAKKISLSSTIGVHIKLRSCSLHESSCLQRVETAKGRLEYTNISWEESGDREAKEKKVNSDVRFMSILACKANQAVFLTKFLQDFHFWHAKTHKKTKKLHVNSHAQFRRWHVLWLMKKIKHTSIVTLGIEMTGITRQLKYYKLQHKYP